MASGFEGNLTWENMQLRLLNDWTSWSPAAFTGKLETSTGALTDWYQQPQTGGKVCSLVDACVAVSHQLFVQLSTKSSNGALLAAATFYFERSCDHMTS